MLRQYCKWFITDMMVVNTDRVGKDDLNSEALQQSSRDLRRDGKKDRYSISSGKEGSKSRETANFKI